VKARAIIAGIAALAAGAAARGEFVPGHIFVAEGAGSYCTQQWLRGGTDKIWEIDPVSGEVTLFVELKDEQCSGISGIVFTPDGQGLRARSYIYPQILEFDSAGNVSVVLDAADHVTPTYGANCLAYDANDNFYISGNYVNQVVLRFPVDGGRVTIYANFFDGIENTGAMAFAADGDLYYLNRPGFDIVRIPPDRVGSIFDESYVGSLVSIAADVYGHLFVSHGPSNSLYRYNAGDAGSKTLLAGMVDFGDLTIALSTDHSVLYAVSYELTRVGRVHTVNPDNGDVSVFVELPDSYTPLSGIAVGPARARSGDANGDDDVDLADFRLWRACFQSFVGAPLPVVCRPGDFDSNGRLNLADFAAFQRMFSGSLGP
jgi:hypothetical protein